MRKAGQKHLPKYAHETKDDYYFRLEHTPFTNVFRDIVEALVARPFSHEAQLENESDQELYADLLENVDGKNNHFSKFAAQLFLKGVSKSIAWVLVDYTTTRLENPTQAQLQESGARPFWVLLDPQDVIAAYTVNFRGKEEFYHVRIREDTLEFEGEEEVKKTNIRIFEREKIYDEEWRLIGLGPVQYTVRQRHADEKEAIWTTIEGGLLQMNGNDTIPLVPFIAGQRQGNGWVVDSIVQSMADLQIELYQQQSGLKNAKENTAFPMLAGSGVSQPQDGKGDAAPLKAGPKAVLYAPPGPEGNFGRWEFIEPSAQSLNFLANDIKETIAQLRELGRQPLTDQAGNLTVITTAVAAQKGNSTVQAWALNLKDSLENVLRLTAMWLNYENTLVPVNIYTDFSVEHSNADIINALIQLRETGNISQQTLLEQMKRRDVLPTDFNVDEEFERINADIITDEDQMSVEGILNGRTALDGAFDRQEGQTNGT